MRTLYQQHMKKVIVSLVLMATIIFSLVYVVLNENISKKYIPEGSAVYSVVQTIQKEKNKFMYQLESIENNFDSLF